MDDQACYAIIPKLKMWKQHDCRLQEVKTEYQLYYGRQGIHPVHSYPSKALSLWPSPEQTKGSHQNSINNYYHGKVCEQKLDLKQLKAP